MLTRTLDRLWRVGLRVAYRLFRLYWRLRRPRLSSVHVALRCQDRLLLIRNSYRSGYSLPAGRPKRGESLAQAAARELREEVGITVAAEGLGPAREIVVRHESVEDHQHFFEIECEREPELEIDRREVVWAAFLGPEEVLGRDLVPGLRRFLACEAGEAPPGNTSAHRSLP